VDVFLVILKSVGMSLGVCAVVLFFIMVGMMFWVRKAVQDRLYCIFLSANRQMRGKLLKAQSDETIVVGSDADAPKYLTHSSKQFWSFWPPGLPRFVQEPVPTLLYVSGNAEPLDPYDRTALISPESLRKISDEAMLKQTWKDVRETLGIRPAFGNNMILLILVVLAMVLSGVAAFLAFSNISKLEAIATALGL